jgi:hypothetical protein
MSKEIHNYIITCADGDLTANNLLVNYIGPNYKQKININNTIYYLETNGYNYKISDFGLAEYIDNTENDNNYINHIYRDYLLLFFLYFNNKKFYNYNKFVNLIELPIEDIYTDLHNGYKKSNKFIKNFVEEYNYNSVCNFMNKYLEIDKNSALLYELPNILLNEFIDIILYI